MCMHPVYVHVPHACAPCTRLMCRPRGRSVIAWGRDFRPDYLRLGELRDRYTGVPWMLLTATLPTQLRVQLFGTPQPDPSPLT